MVNLFRYFIPILFVALIQDKFTSWSLLWQFKVLLVNINLVLQWKWLSFSPCFKHLPQITSTAEQQHMTMKHTLFLEVFTRSFNFKLTFGQVSLTVRTQFLEMGAYVSTFIYIPWSYSNVYCISMCNAKCIS